MANRCQIEISIPITEIPDKEERSEYQALYDAEKRWESLPGINAPFGKEYEEFMASQPGVPTNTHDPESLGKLSISASFYNIDGHLWVHPYIYKYGDGLTYHLGKSQITRVAMDWSFKHSFPWWAQIGFADGEKQFGIIESNEPDHRGWLCWKSEVTKILENLEYAIKAHETFPVSNQAKEWLGVYSDLDKLTDIYGWFGKVNRVSNKAVAVLNWSEVGYNVMHYEHIKNNNEPNEIMDTVKQMASDIKQLESGKLSFVKFRKKYALSPDKFVSATSKDPFEGEIFPW